MRTLRAPIQFGATASILIIPAMYPARKVTRRELILASGAGTLQTSVARAQSPKPTNFQIACMTLPYAQFPLGRAFEGIRRAGFRFVVWGTTHMEGGSDRKPVIAVDAPPAETRRLASRCRDIGLEPVMLSSTVQLEAADAAAAHARRIDQGAAAGIPFCSPSAKPLPVNTYVVGHRWRVI